MSYQAKVYRAMIASPNDVLKERCAARDVLFDWNCQRSFISNTMLEPMCWETHSAPEMGSDGAQSVINKQMLSTTDLLIGIFWSRIGTKTPKAASGTVEEIEEHVKVGKPVMLYFSKQPIPQNKLDMNQIQKLKDLKKKYKERALVYEYNSLDEFKKMLYQHIEFRMNRIGGKESILEGSTICPSPTMTEQAKILITEAAKSSDRMILKYRVMGKLMIITNKKQFAATGDTNVETIFERAIEELHEERYITESGNKGETFILTNKGITVANSIELASAKRPEV